MNEFLELTFLNNTLKNWFIVVATIALTSLVIRLLRSVVFKRLNKWAASTRTSWDEFILKVIEKNVLPLLYISTIYFSLRILDFGATVTNVLHVAYMMCITFYVVKIIVAAFKKFVLSFIQRDENRETKEKQAGGLIAIVSIIIWILGVVFLIDNMGYNVTTIVAGLGVGGIAIALAAQAVLGDLFSYFVIFFDRPFEIGDFVIIGDDNGIVEYIGIKTTRIRTLNGEQLVCSNTDLTNSRLRNFKRMERRRIVFTLGVVYNTTAEQLKNIPGTVKQIIDAQDKVSYDRGHFSGFGDFSLNFEFVYYVEDADYTFYMDSQQAIYLAIFTAFEKQGIDFAFPTQTIQIDNPPLSPVS